jgi:hypothetical protein
MPALGSHVEMPGVGDVSCRQRLSTSTFLFVGLSGCTTRSYHFIMQLAGCFGRWAAQVHVRRRPATRAVLEGPSGTRGRNLGKISANLGELSRDKPQRCTYGMWFCPLQAKFQLCAPRLVNVAEDGCLVEPAMLELATTQAQS